MKTNTVTYPDAVQEAYNEWAQAAYRAEQSLSRPNAAQSPKFIAACKQSEIAYTTLCAVCRAHGIDPDTLDNPR